MHIVIRGAILAAILSAPVVAKKDEGPLDPGPRPDAGEFRTLAEQSILSSFFDPSSAQFQWNYGMVGGYYKPVLQRKIAGWWTCGMVNGKNRMGGYVGFRSFVVVMNNGRIVFSAVGDGDNFDVISMQCQQATMKGILPPPEAAGRSPVVATPISLGLAPALGFTYRNQSDSIAIAEVSPGGLASAAELTPFMVVEKVNGLSLDGLSPEMRSKLLDNAGAGAVLTVRGRGDMKMERPAPGPAAAPAAAIAKRAVQK